jgi:hypothetical protein
MRKKLRSSWPELIDGRMGPRQSDDFNRHFVIE